MNYKSFLFYWGGWVGTLFRIFKHFLPLEKQNKFKPYLRIYLVAEEVQYQSSGFEELILKVRDLEEKNRIMKDRTMLIGQNLVELKNQVTQSNSEIKKELEELKNILERTRSFMSTASEEFSKFARKEDLEILQKQAKLFQPLDFVRKKDLKELIG